MRSRQSPPGGARPWPIAAGDRPRERRRAPVGPVGGGPQDQWRQQLAGVLDAQPLEQLAGGFLQRDQQVGGDRGRGVVGGAALLGDLEGPHAERIRPATARRSSPPGRSRRSRPGCPRPESRRPAKVCSGCREKVEAPRSRAAARASRVLAPLTWPTNGEERPPRCGAQTSAIASSGTQSSTAPAPSTEPVVARRRSAPRAPPARRPAPAMRPRGRGQRRPAARRSGGRGGIPFQFPHRRYQTACLCGSNWCSVLSFEWVRAGFESRPAAKYRERSWPLSQLHADSEWRESAQFAARKPAQEVVRPNYHQPGADLRVRV